MPDRIASDALEQLADQFAQAWINRRQIDCIPPVLIADRRDAYHVQDLMARRIGEPVAGWKAGATSEGMRARDGHDGIVPGRIFTCDLHIGNELRLDASHFPAGQLEPEFAFRFLRSPPIRSNWSSRELASFVVPHIAMEIIGSRMDERLPPTCRTTAMTIADNGNGFALIIGPEIPVNAIYDPLTHPVDMHLDDGTFAANVPPDIRAQPIEALTDTVNLLGARKIALEAGQYITTGSATATLPIVQGTTATADFGALGIIHIAFI